MKKKHLSRMPGNAAYAFCACLLLNIFFLYGCGGDGASNQPANDASGTGSFACTLVWPHDDPALENTPSAARAVMCQSAGIDVVCFTFYRSTDLVDRFYFECDAHFGRVEDLPVGVGYRVEITAEDADGVVLYQGEYGPFEITEGKTTPGGVIAMEPAGPLAAVVGSWSVIYDWDCDEYYDGTMTMTLEDNFTFTAYEAGYGDSLGTWSLWAGELVGIFEDGTAFYGYLGGDYLYGDIYYGEEWWGCWEGYPNVEADVNLTGTQYAGNSSFSVDQSGPVWGQWIDINWAITNDGAENIPAGTDEVWVGFFLSEDAFIDDTDYVLGFGWLDQIFYNGLSSGAGLHGTIQWQLPIDSPFDSSSGTFYIGMIVDSYDAVAETSEDDNAGTGEGIDYVPVYIDYFY